jgi:ketosteroid isomerase-like protein
MSQYGRLSGREGIGAECRAYGARTTRERRVIMGNADTHRASHQAFDRRDWADLASRARDDVEFTDHPRGTTVKGKQEYIDYLKGWPEAFSDATPADPQYIDAGDHSIAIFYASGTNDGAVGPMPATGKRMHMPMCEVMRYDSNGKIAHGELFYDMATMMIQLGHMEAPPS